MFIVFEGADRVGKTTLANKTLSYLADRRPGRNVLTYEPTDSLRTKLKICSAEDPLTEASWFANDRKEHIDNIITPILRRGWNVICDRYYYSSIVYQSVTDDPTIERDIQDDIWEMNKDFPVPDIIFLVQRDVPVEELSTEDKFESPLLQERVRERYKEIILRYASRAEKRPMIFIIDSSDIQAAFRAVRKALDFRTGSLRISPQGQWDKE